MGSGRDVGSSAQPVAVEGRSMAVVYGSETGNAEDMAHHLWDMARRLHFQAVLDEMDGFKLSSLLGFSLVIFVTSTTGQGEMPANCQKLWKTLRRQRLNTTKCLSPLRFAILGLGDSSYLKFNWAARKLRRRLLQLGATEFFKCAEADERHDNGLDSICLPWCAHLRAHLLAEHLLPDGLAPIPDEVQLPPRYLLHLAPTLGGPASGVPARAGPSLPSDFLLPIPGAIPATLMTNKRVTPPSHWQDVRLLAFNVEGGKEDAKLPKGLPDPEEGVFNMPGATIELFPKNDPEDVNTMIQLMDWGDVADKEVVWESAHGWMPMRSCRPSETEEEDVAKMNGGSPLPQGLHGCNDGSMTLRDLLTHNFDITATPKRLFIQQLAWITKDEREQERLRELIRREDDGAQEYWDYVSRPRRTILELLQDFPAVRIPWPHALDLLPLIRGRRYSLCNGGRGCAGVREDGTPFCRFEILASLVEYRTIIRKPRQGLCSRYFRRLQAGTGVVVKLHDDRPMLRVDDAQARRPLIAVATGTGIAPIASLILTRDAAEKAPGDVLLFFGCRSQDADFYYRHLWARIGIEVYPAFSRDPVVADSAGGGGGGGGGAGKNYVQHHIRKHAQRVGQLMRQNPIVCVCGSAGGMPKAVRAALADTLFLSGVVGSKDAGEAWLADERNCMYWQEAW